MVKAGHVEAGRRYDRVKKLLLVCTGIWEVQNECPGSVSVVCAGVGYDVTDLDEKNQPK